MTWTIVLATVNRLLSLQFCILARLLSRQLITYAVGRSYGLLVRKRTPLKISTLICALCRRVSLLRRMVEVQTTFDPMTETVFGFGDNLGQLILKYDLLCCCCCIRLCFFSHACSWKTFDNFPVRNIAIIPAFKLNRDYILWSWQMRGFLRTANLFFGLMLPNDIVAYLELHVCVALLSFGLSPSDTTTAQFSHLLSIFSFAVNLKSNLPVSSQC